jgi:hypothetical protein
MSKYRPYTQIRNSPADDLETAFANEEADREVGKLLSRYASEPGFLKRIAVRLGQEALKMKDRKEQ